MELLDTGGVTLIEWGDAVAFALPPDFLEVRLEFDDDDDDVRRVDIRAVGRAWASRIDDLQRGCARWSAES
jgi:tRNA A37 threonylcarbamoyladenosine biosynthesis protein TsaE